MSRSCTDVLGSSECKVRFRYPFLRTYVWTIVVEELGQPHLGGQVARKKKVRGEGSRDGDSLSQQICQSPASSVSGIKKACFGDRRGAAAGTRLDRVCCDGASVASLQGLL